MATTTTIPDRLQGKWAVVSSQTPGEEKLGGEILDEWIITPDSLACDAGILHVRKVEAKDEPHQALVLVSFADNSLQYAFMSSQNQPDVVLVIFYSGGVEKMRCAITQRVSSKVAPAAEH